MATLKITEKAAASSMSEKAHLLITQPDAEGKERLYRLPSEKLLAADAICKKAPAVLLEDAGDIVTTEIAAAERAISLVTDIELVQEGTGDPYPAGGGKNLCVLPSSAKTSNGITATPLDNGGLRVAGTATESVFIHLASVKVYAGKTYTLSGVVNGHNDTYQLYAEQDSLCWYNQNTTSTKQVTVDGIAKIFFVVRAGVTIGVTVYPQFEVGSAATEFAPAVNIRPIIGWNKLCAGRYRHNMLHVTAESKVTNGISFTINPDKSVTVNGTATANAYLQFYEGFTLPSGDFVLSGCPAGGNDKTRFSLQLYRIIDGMSKIFTADNGSGLAFSSEPNMQYTVTIVVREGWTADNLVFYPMLQPKGVSADYEPGDVQMVSADLPETVYGGTPEWTTGLLTVTHARYNFTGNENWSVSSVQRPELGIRFDTSKIAGQPLAKNNAVISDTYPFAGVTMPGCWVTTKESGYFAARILWPDYATVDDLKSYLAKRYDAGNPVCMVYELAEPYTIQLAPQQLELLKGKNVIWSNAGQVHVRYVADSEMLLEGKAERAAVEELGADVQAVAAELQNKAPLLTCEAETAPAAAVTMAQERTPVAMVTEINPVVCGENPTPESPCYIMGHQTVQAHACRQMNMLAPYLRSFTEQPTEKIKVTGGFNDNGEYSLAVEIAASSPTEKQENATVVVTEADLPAGILHLFMPYEAGCVQTSVFYVAKSGEEEKEVLALAMSEHNAQLELKTPQKVRIKLGITAGGHINQDRYIALTPAAYIGGSCSALPGGLPVSVSQALPETVWGGRYDWCTGQMTVTRSILSAAENSRVAKVEGSEHVFRWGHNLTFAAGNAICSHLKYGSAYKDKEDSFYVNDTYIYMTILDCSTEEEALAWLIDNDVVFCGMLSAPYTIQLEPQQLIIPAGDSFVWSSNGNTSLVYAKELTAVIGSLCDRIAALESKI